MKELQAGTNLSHKNEQYCRYELEKILTKTFQPMVIKELLLLQGGPGGDRGSARNSLPQSSQVADTSLWPIVIREVDAT